MDIGVISFGIGMIFGSIFTGYLKAKTIFISLLGGFAILFGIVT